MTMRRTTIYLSLALFLSRVVQSEIITLSFILNADSSEIHYVRGWLDAPAHIDFSKTRFMTATVPGFDDDYNTENDDFSNSESPTNNPDASTPEPNTPPPTAAPVKTTRAPRPTTLSPTSAPVRTTRAPRPTTPTPSAAPVKTTRAPRPTTPSTSSPVARTRTPRPPTRPAATPTPVAVPSPPPTGNRRAIGTIDSSRQLNATSGGGPRVKQYLDIVLFKIPEKCKTNAWGGCDWSALGVGMRDDKVSGGVNYCCSEDAVSSGSCTSSQMGRLIVNKNLFKGDLRSIEVPTEADKEFGLKDPIFEISVTGEYVLLLGNCDDYGMDVFSVGSMEWKSVKGYLPGEMFGLMFFYVALVITYLILVLWYYCGMRLYQDAAIPIQKFILATIALGVVEFFFRALDLGKWNLDGVRSATIVWMAVIIGVLKRGITRCLFVMVSMGWGVVRDSLGFALVKIIILGAIYCALTMARDFLLVLAVDKVESWSSSAEQELLDLLLIITLALAAVNMIFFFWILSSLSATTEYLKSMNQTTKLRRHLRLRCIIMTSFAVALAWLIFSIVDGIVGILSSNQYWVLEGITYLNSLFVILSVAILWRPNSNAKDYAMQMEVPAMGEDGEHELELSCVVPSAGEFDDNDDADQPSNLPVDHAVHS